MLSAIAPPPTKVNGQFCLLMAYSPTCLIRASRLCSQLFISRRFKSLSLKLYLPKRKRSLSFCCKKKMFPHLHNFYFLLELVAISQDATLKIGHLMSKKYRAFNLNLSNCMQLWSETSNDVLRIGANLVTAARQCQTRWKKIKNFELACVTGGVGYDVTAGNRPRAGRCAPIPVWVTWSVLTLVCNTSHSYCVIINYDGSSKLVVIFGSSNDFNNIT